MQCYTGLAEAVQRQERWNVAAVCRSRQLELAVELNAVQEQAQAHQGQATICYNQGQMRQVVASVLQVACASVACGTTGHVGWCIPVQGGAHIC